MGKSIGEVLDLQQEVSDRDLSTGRSLKLEMIIADQELISA